MDFQDIEEGKMEDVLRRKEVSMDNRYVVPYNPYFSTKYQAHINVEICNSIKSCKYLYKYVYKGPDMASVSTEVVSQRNNEGETSEGKNIDEIAKFVNSRFMTSSEGFWKICSFDTHGRDPSIQRLAVHEENTQMVMFNEENPEEAVSIPKDTTLFAWFKLNKIDPSAKGLMYHEIPEHYVWKQNHQWAARKQKRCIGHMYTTNPSQGERHYLHILLHHIPGTTSFADLRTSPDGTIHRTFKETAIALGLLETDEEWNDCMSEAAVSFMPKQLRSLFVTILVFGEPAHPCSLWEKFKESMGGDLKNASASLQVTADDLKKCVENEVLLLLQDELEAINTCLQDFGLPIQEKQGRHLMNPKVIQEEIFNIEIQQEISDIKQRSLNSSQQQAFSRIMKAVQDQNHPQRVFFLNAPGGYGKTFLLEALLSTVS